MLTDGEDLTVEDMSFIQKYLSRLSSILTKVNPLPESLRGILERMLELAENPFQVCMKQTWLSFVLQSFINVLKMFIKIYNSFSET